MIYIKIWQNGKLVRHFVPVKELGANVPGSYYDIVTLTTFGFQAPEFYKKHGFAIEYIRENKDPKISKYFLTKPL